MRKSRLAEAIVHALKEDEAATRTADIRRRLGIAVQTFGRWKAKSGGLEASDAKCLKSLEFENARGGPSPRFRPSHARGLARLAPSVASGPNCAVMDGTRRSPLA